MTPLDADCVEPSGRASPPPEPMPSNRCKRTVNLPRRRCATVPAHADVRMEPDDERPGAGHEIAGHADCASSASRSTERRRRVAQIETMIAEFQRMSADLDREIAAEEAKAGISDPAHFAYPTYARAATQRRDNLRRSAARPSRAAQRRQGAARRGLRGPEEGRDPRGPGAQRRAGLENRARPGRHEPDRPVARGRPVGTFSAIDRPVRPGRPGAEGRSGAGSSAISIACA